MIGLLLLFWILNLVRNGRLYVGYGIILVAADLSTIVILSVPQLLTGVTRLVGARFPASALTLLAIAFLVLMLIYVLTQITIVSDRVAKLLQELAIQKTKETGQAVVKEDNTPE
jgi:hypothetical protein